MATDASDETPETALPVSPGKGRTGKVGAKFNELIAWIIGEEEDNPALRVIAINSDDDNAPDYVRVKYSFPPVKKGVNGYEVAGGLVKPFPG